jgi:Na+-driven multidrug efflux pump
MRSSGTVTMPMMINIAAILCIEVPCAYWFSSLWGLKGIWYAYALAFVSLHFTSWLLSIFLEEKAIKALI